MLICRYYKESFTFNLTDGFKIKKAIFYQSSTSLNISKETYLHFDANEWSKAADNSFTCIIPQNRSLCHNSSPMPHLQYNTTIKQIPTEISHKHHSLVVPLLVYPPKLWLWQPYSTSLNYKPSPTAISVNLVYSSNLCCSSKW